MNTKNLFVLAMATLWSVLPAKSPAQTWQTVLDYQLTPGQFAQGSALAADTAGDVFCGGTAADRAAPLTDTAHGLVLKTDISAVNWFLSDDPTAAPSQYSARVWWGLGFDVQGSLYSVGTLTPKGSSYPYPSSWLVRKSSDGGLSWSTANLFQYSSGLTSEGKALAIDTSGTVYVAGYGTSPAANKSQPNSVHWLVRKSIDGGLNWTLIDDFFNPLKGGFPQWGIPHKATCVPGAGVLVIGQASSNPQGFMTVWIVRRSLDGGTTWSTADLNPPGGSASVACANGVTSDPDGKIYVVGRIDFSQVIAHKTYTTGQWVVRVSNDGGVTWSNIDVLSVGPGRIASAGAVGIDAAGKPVVAGQYQDANNVYHWIVRRPDAFGNWQTVDDFQLASGYEAGPQDLLSDAAGNLLVAGYADDAAGSHWVVRRLASSTP
jgi:hypothetical protein